VVGREPEWVRGRHVREVVGEAAWQAIREDLERAMRGEPVAFERRLPYPAGPRWTYSTYTPDRTAGGEVVGLVVHVLDIGKLRERRRRSAPASSACRSRCTASGTRSSPPTRRAGWR
jgi:PAS domain-containing protein